MPVAVLQARALRGMPSQLSGANRDKHTRSSKIDRESEEWEKPEGMGGLGRDCSLFDQERRILRSPSFERGLIGFMFISASVRLVGFYRSVD